LDEFIEPGARRFLRNTESNNEPRNRHASNSCNSWQRCLGFPPSDP
jgi:hypothetical protein